MAVALWMCVRRRRGGFAAQPEKTRDSCRALVDSSSGGRRLESSSIRWCLSEQRTLPIVRDYDGLGFRGMLVARNYGGLVLRTLQTAFRQQRRAQSRSDSATTLTRAAKASQEGHQASVS